MPSPVESGRVRRDREALAGAAGREHDVCRARTNSTSPSGASASTPRAATALDEQLDREPALAHLDVAARATAATSARSISAPVASPPACTTRASEWPPSRASSSSAPPAPARCRTRAPSAASSRTRSGPSVTSTRTASTSQRPAPAVSVSARCSSGESGAAERGGDAALRVPGRRVRRARPSSARARDRPLARGVERGRQTGDAAPEHEDVDHAGQPRWRRRMVCASRRGSSRRAAPPRPRRSAGSRSSTCTICGAYAGELGLVVVGVRDDDHAVAGLHEPGRGAVEDHVAGSARHRVRLEAGAVVDVEHVRPARTRGCRRAPSARGSSVIEPT